MTCRTIDDEKTPEAKAAQERSEKADDAFADAPATSVAGALAKMRFLLEFCVEDRDTSLEARHIRTGAAFLEGCLGGAAPDPAVAALAQFMEAKAAEEAFPDAEAVTEPPGYLAAGDRRYAAERAVCDAVPTSLAGVAAKIRFLLDYEEEPADLWGLFNIMAKSMLPFLEGGAAAVPPAGAGCDPVVTLSAEWGAIQDEMMAISADDPESKDPDNKLWEAALERLRALEHHIIETPSASIAGVAIKLRIATHWTCDSADLANLHATPAREIDYEKECLVVLWTAKPIISALCDAERLAGAS